MLVSTRILRDRHLASHGLLSARTRLKSQLSAYSESPSRSQSESGSRSQSRLLAGILLLQAEILSTLDI